MSENASATAVCILNADAGSAAAKDQRENLETLFKARNRDVRLILAQGDDIVRHAKEAVANKAGLVMAGGGDGTVNAVAGVVAGTDTVLAVLPCGTLNHFAKDLKIPLELEGAVETAFCGDIARVDIGEVNGRTFLNNSSLGLYPGLVKVRESLQQRGYSKWPAFGRALAFALWRYAPLTVQLSVKDERQKAITAPFVFIGNNKYELAAPHAGERASLHEGKLWIYQAPHAGRWKLFRLAIASLLGHARDADLVVFDAQAFEIRTRKTRVRVANDGELMHLASPLRYRSKPGALRVMVPKAAANGA